MAWIWKITVASFVIIQVINFSVCGPVASVDLDGNDTQWEEPGTGKPVEVASNESPEFADGSPDSESEEQTNTRFSSLSVDPDDVEFFLYYDPANPETFRKLVLNDTKGMKKAKFRIGAQVIFITHGFMSGYNFSNSLVPIVKNAYLSQNIVNIIAVDWSKLSTAPAPESILSYYAVVKRSPIVGNRIADFILFLIRSKIIGGPEDVHLVGHSLGAHVSGICGQAVLNRTGVLVDRITGLDPAGPLYQLARDEYRLDSGDGAFVDILHTAVGTLGSGDLHGHVDFFANGGRGTAQTGCLNFTLGNLGPFLGTGLTGICSHSRAYQYYARSIRRIKPELYGCRIFITVNWLELSDSFYLQPRARGNFFVDVDKAPACV